MPIRREPATISGPGFGNGRRSVLNAEQTGTADNSAAAGERSMALNLAPRWQVAAFAALAGGIVGILTPIAWIERLSFELYLDQLTPAAAAPLGTTARILFAVALASVFGLLGWAATRFVLRPKVREGVPPVAHRSLDRAREAVAAAPTLRRADAHPDAPSRAPLRADLDLPADGLDPARPAFDASRIAPPVAATADEDAGDDGNVPDGAYPAELESDELDLAGMEFADDAAFGASASDPVAADPAPIAATTTQASAPFSASLPPTSGRSIADDSLAAKLARFEAGLGRRATEPPVQGHAVPRLGDLTPDSPAVDAALQSALSTLERLSRRAAI